MDALEVVEILKNFRESGIPTRVTATDTLSATLLLAETIRNSEYVADPTNARLLQLCERTMSSNPSIGHWLERAGRIHATNVFFTIDAIGRTKPS